MPFKHYLTADPRSGGGFRDIGTRLARPWLAILLGFSVGGAALAESSGRPLFPAIQLPQRLRGEQALQSLGDNIPSVAAWYRMTPLRFRDIMLRDPTAWVDRRGRVLYIEDQVQLPEPIETALSLPGLETVAPYGLEQTFLLHSRPNARRVIYLDFDGHVSTGSAWNKSYGSTINASPYDLDGDPTAFNTSERERIQYIWQRVAEDYLPFDVDVTTQEPPPDRITRSTSNDDSYGTRAVITRDFTASTGSPCNCGGFAYLGVFDYYPNDYYKPAWVFYNQLGSGNEKYVAEAVSHEVGHNLGLNHDGSSTSSYYAGHGTGATGWAPIMGVGYSKEVVQWSKGEYPGANNTEDDIAIIQANGAPLLADDYGNTTATAAPLGSVANGSSAAVDQGGEIERRTDSDLFTFVTAGGSIQLDATPGPRGPNLDISLALYDAFGSLVSSSNPVDTLGAALNGTVAPGTYYVRIDGIEKGTLTTGYSDYGSLGAYRITGSYPSSGAGSPVAMASASPSSGVAPLTVSFAGSGSYAQSPERIVAYDWTFGDGPEHSAAVNPSHTYTAAGTYQVALTVTDSQDRRGSTALTVAVDPDPSAFTVHVGNIDMSVVLNNGYYRGMAKVTVLNKAGQVIPGAVVTGQWSGLVAGGVVSATTNTSGVAQFKSSRTRSKGTFTFTVKGISLSGYNYDASQNAETTDGISN